MEHVEHFTEGRSLSQAGIKVLLRRNKEYLCAMLINLLAGGIFAWMEFLASHPVKETGVTFTISVLRLLVFLSLFVALMVFLIWKWKRRQSGRVERVRAKLHELAHLLRDRVADAEAFTEEAKETRASTQAVADLASICNESCNVIRDFFRALIGDSTIECCIRLAAKKTNNPSDPQVFYFTQGRSDGLNPSRDKTSEPIPANKGVPRFFLDRPSCMGVLVYHDLKKAISFNTFVQTQNEVLYPNEISTLMVAPINGWAGKRVMMIGLLYVTSRNDRFRQEHVDSMRMSADMLGTAVPRIVDAFSGKRPKKGKAR